MAIGDGICIGFAAQALCNYAQQAWLPTFFVRVHGWSPRQAGLTLGVLSLATGLSGAYLGGRLTDRWQRRGMAKKRRCAWPCWPPPPRGSRSRWPWRCRTLDLQLALLAPAFFFLAMPIGSVYASLQLILPNQVRGQIGALQVFTLNLGG